MDSSNPSYQSMDCAIKRRNRFINSIKFFFICLIISITMQQRKNSWDELKKKLVKTGSASATP